MHVILLCVLFFGTPLSAPLAPQSSKPPRAKEKKPAEKKEDWKALFDGASLNGWKQSGFAGGGEFRLEPKFQENKPALVVETGVALSGFNWTKAEELPKTNYEITLEAMKIQGSDFFCGLTFPVENSHASLILGGWGGGLVGISSIDGMDASQNDTTRYLSFSPNKWYRIRLRVTPAKIESWLDDKQIVDANIAGKKISLRHGEIQLSVPLGFSTYQTKAAFRNIKLKRLEPGKGEKKGRAGTP